MRRLEFPEFLELGGGTVGEMPSDSSVAGCRHEYSASDHVTIWYKIITLQGVLKNGNLQTNRMTE